MTFLNTLHYKKRLIHRRKSMQSGTTCLFIVIVLFFKKFNAPWPLFAQVYMSQAAQNYLITMLPLCCTNRTASMSVYLPDILWMPR